MSMYNIHNTRVYKCAHAYLYIYIHVVTYTFTYILTYYIMYLYTYVNIYICVHISLHILESSGPCGAGLWPLLAEQRSPFFPLTHVPPNPQTPVISCTSQPATYSMPEQK